jgi:hypothetical protein
MFFLVSILSEQPVQNLLIIKQFSRLGIKHILLTTTRIEAFGISKNLIFASGISNNDFNICVIDPADPSLIKIQLDSFRFDRNAKYLVNVTGGTKMMSQSVSAHFMHGFPKSRIVYLDINTGHLSELHPNPGLTSLPGRDTLSLGDFFSVHGYTRTHQQHRHKSPVQTRQLMADVIRRGGIGAMYKLKPPYEKHADLNDRTYYSGGWFEEWLWYAIKAALNLKDSEIMHGVKLYNHLSRKSDSDHELDVAFVYNGRLYIAECKAFMKYEGEKFNKTAFKLAGISRNLGYACKSIICISVQIPDTAMPHVEDLTKAIGVNGVISWNELSSDRSFTQALHKIVKH